MNKVITDGLVLMPPSFGEGLDVWSREDGTPGTETYAGVARYVSGDQSFGGALEMTKTQTVTHLRYMGETCLMPGCYVRVSTRVKCLSGPLPDVRIAGWAAHPGGAQMHNIPTNAPSVSIDTYGEAVTVSAIIGTGPRTGVDLAWPGASYGHFGIDLTGPNGGVVRVDDIVIEDVTALFMRDMLGVVDVRDYGAIGDGTTDDAAAFLAADADSHGRDLLVPTGTYFLGKSVSLQSSARFQGRVIMAEPDTLALSEPCNFASYVEAFGDPEMAFKKAVQALGSGPTDGILDLGGHRIGVHAPVDLRAIWPGDRPFKLQNGALYATGGPAWATSQITGQALSCVNAPATLTHVEQIGAIAVGAQVSGRDIPRDVFVTQVDRAQATVTLSAPLEEGFGSRDVTFTRPKYLLDFSGFETPFDITLDRVALACAGVSSGLITAPSTCGFRLRDCDITGVDDHGIVVIGTACQPLIVDRCTFVGEHRSAIGMTLNGDDAIVRQTRAAGFQHSAIMHGHGAQISDNQWATGGLILAGAQCETVVSGNRFTNAGIEWHDDPAVAQGPFGGLVICGNTFCATDVGPTFRWITLAPVGDGRGIAGLSVQNNRFEARGCVVERVEAIDTRRGKMDFNRMRNIVFAGNTYTGVADQTRNPYVAMHRQNAASQSWEVNTRRVLPFGGWTRTVDALVPVQAIRTSGGDPVFAQPYADPVNGAKTDEFRLIWPQAVKGQVRFSVRMDDPA